MYKVAYLPSYSNLSCFFPHEKNPVLTFELESSYSREQLQTTYCRCNYEGLYTILKREDGDEIDGNRHTIADKAFQSLPANKAVKFSSEFLFVTLVTFFTMRQMRQDSRKWKNKRNTIGLLMEKLRYLRSLPSPFFLANS